MNGMRSICAGWMSRFWRAAERRNVQAGAYRPSTAPVPRPPTAARTSPRAPGTPSIASAPRRTPSGICARRLPLPAIVARRCLASLSSRTYRGASHGCPRRRSAWWQVCCQEPKTTTMMGQVCAVSLRRACVRRSVVMLGRPRGAVAQAALCPQRVTKKTVAMAFRMAVTTQTTD